MTKALALGPFMIAGDRAAVLVGIAVFLLAAKFIDRRIAGRLGSVPGTAVLVGLVGARLGYAAIHHASFLAEPWRLVMIWEGGFSPWIGLLAALATLVVSLPGLGARLWATGAFAAGVLTWNIAIQLMTVSSAIALPESPFRTLQGEAFRFEDADGPIVVNFWATWCPPCRREMPMLAEAAANTPGVDFVFANQGEQTEAIAAYFEGNGIDLGHGTVVTDGFGELPRHYGVRGLPATLFMSADGTILGSHFGQISKEAPASAVARLREKNKGN